ITCGPPSRILTRRSGVSQRTALTLPRRAEPGGAVSSGCLAGPELVEDPGLHALDLAGASFGRTQVVEVPSLAAGPERAGREGHVHLPLGRAPERETHQLHARKRSQLLVEDELSLANQTLGDVFLLHELHTHLFLQSGRRRERD